MPLNPDLLRAVASAMLPGDLERASLAPDELGEAARDALRASPRWFRPVLGADGRDLRRFLDASGRTVAVTSPERRHQLVASPAGAWLAAVPFFDSSADDVLFWGPTDARPRRWCLPPEAGVRPWGFFGAILTDAGEMVLDVGGSELVVLDLDARTHRRVDARRLRGPGLQCARLCAVDWEAPPPPMRRSLSPRGAFEVVWPTIGECVKIAVRRAPSDAPHLAPRLPRGRVRAARVADDGSGAADVYAGNGCQSIVRWDARGRSEIVARDPEGDLVLLESDGSHYDHALGAVRVGRALEPHRFGPARSEGGRSLWMREGLVATPCGPAVAAASTAHARSEIFFEIVGR